MLDFPQLAHQCAPAVHANTLAHVVQVESGYNPYAIGVVGAHLERQPRNRDEALATAAWLATHHFNYSVGLAQVNQSNFTKYRLTVATAFEPCRNLQVAAAILTDCYLRAYQIRSDKQPALHDAFSCYYSGTFTTGYKVGYVIKVVMGKPDIDHRRSTDSGQQSNPTSVKPPAQGSKEPLSALVF